MPYGCRQKQVNRHVKATEHSHDVWLANKVADKVGWPVNRRYFPEYSLLNPPTTY